MTNSILLEFLGLSFYTVYIIFMFLLYAVLAIVFFRKVSKFKNSR